MNIRKGLLGLKKAGRLASNKLTKNLSRNGYAPVPHTPSLWHHHTSDLVFYLVVDDFGIKYTRKADVNHLLNSLQGDYKITKDWTRDKYLSLTLKWYCVNRNLSVSMSGYVKADLLKFQHEATTKLQDAPHRWNEPTYGAKTQYANNDKANLVDANSTLYVQQVCGTFLYYAIAVNQTILASINAISASQANTTTTTMGDIVWLLNYTATPPNATIHYHSNEMILPVASDASYLCKKRARSRDRGHFFLANQLVENGDNPSTLPTNNGAIHTLCHIIDTVMPQQRKPRSAPLF